MKSLLFGTIVIGFILSSCKKDDYDRYKEAKEYVLVAAPFDSLEDDAKEDSLYSQKLVKIETQSEIDYLMANNSTTGPLDKESRQFVENGAKVNFEDNDVYLFYCTMQGQDSPTLVKDKIYIDDDKEELFCDFKVKVHVGGSGMGNQNLYWILEIPKAKSHYSKRIEVFVNEYRVMSPRKHHDFTIYIEE